MPRRPRLILPDIPLHIIQRGNNRSVCFHGEEDFLFYLDWLARAAHDTGCAVNAYWLMSKHVHLLLTARATDSAGALMKMLGQHYVQYVNRSYFSYRRGGTLREGRFRSCLLHEDGYLLECYRYIELNPVRAVRADGAQLALRLT